MSYFTFKYNNGPSATASSVYDLGPGPVNYISFPNLFYNIGSELENNRLIFTPNDGTPPIDVIISAPEGGGKITRSEYINLIRDLIAQNVTGVTLNLLYGNVFRLVSTVNKVYTVTSTNNYANAMLFGIQEPIQVSHGSSRLYSFDYLLGATDISLYGDDGYITTIPKTNIDSDFGYITFTPTEGITFPKTLSFLQMHVTYGSINKRIVLKGVQSVITLGKNK